MSETDTNWIKLSRKLLVNDLWKSEPFTKGQAWVDLLLLANHTDGFFLNRGIQVNVKRGQVGYSELQLSIRWKWSRTKVKKFFELLEKEQQIVQHRNNVSTLITIVNYNLYQPEVQQKEQQKSNRRATEVQQKSTNKNEKNEKTENNNRVELHFREVFGEREEYLKRLYPHVDFEVEKETCIAYHRKNPSIADPIVPIHQWFKRIPKPKETPPPPAHASTITTERDRLNLAAARRRIEEQL